MIPGLVGLLQVVIPVILLGRLFQARRLSLLASMLFLAGLVTYMATIAVAGLWLVLPWYTALAYLAIAAVALLWRAGDIRSLRWKPARRLAVVELGICAVFVAAASALFAQSVAARQALVARPAVNLSFPLRGGTYYIANGGGGELTNAHVETLADRARDDRGQSHAVDIVRIDDRGVRASAPVPTSLSHEARGTGGRGGAVLNELVARRKQMHESCGMMKTPAAPRTDAAEADHAGHHPAQ